MMLAFANVDTDKHINQPIALDFCHLDAIFSALAIWWLVAVGLGIYFADELGGLPGLAANSYRLFEINPIVCSLLA
jgi:uncharacterized membrane protein